MSAARLFRYGCIAFIFGVAGASFVEPRWFVYEAAWFALALSSTAVGLFIYRHSPEHVSRYVFFVVLGLAGFGSWRYAVSIERITPQHIAHYNGMTVEFSGVIAAEPDIREKNQRLAVETQFSISPQDGPARGRVYVIVPRYPEYAYGDAVHVTCELTEPEPLEGFAYDRYLARQGIYSTCFYPRISIKDSADRQTWHTPLFALKRRIAAVIDRGLPEPQAGIVAAMVLGYRGRMDEPTSAIFARAGISHIVAISGMHIAILTGIAVYGLLALGLWRWQALWAGVMLVWLYILMIGAPASAARAGVMATVIVSAVSLGRLNVTLRALLYAAVVLLLANPKLLRDDVGFQLSFLAVAGIAALHPLWARARTSISEQVAAPRPVLRFGLGMGDLVFMTVAAQVLTLPIILWNFGLLSIGSIVANLAVVWLVPFIMIGTLIAALISLMLSGAAWLWFLPVRVAVGYVVAIAQMTGVAYEVEWPPLWIILLYYTVIGGMYWYFMKILSRKSYAISPQSNE